MAAPMATGDRPRIDFNTLAASVEIPVLICAHDASAITADVSTKDAKNPLTNQAAFINQAAYGKKAGAMVQLFKAASATDKRPAEDGYLGLAVAMGSGKSAKWQVFGAGAAASAKIVQITPAA